jgi:hypothetical protein
VLQVDGEGNMIEDAYANAYKEESLKALAKRKAPECIKNVVNNGR